MFYELLFGMTKTAGRIMRVRFSGLKTDPACDCVKTTGTVWMPECEAYKNIINGDDKTAKAALIRRFYLNLPKNIAFTSCKARILD